MPRPKKLAGVYGLTKGQFSATSELDAELKSGEKNPFGQMDICSLAIQAGAPLSPDLFQEIKNNWSLFCKQP